MVCILVYFTLLLTWSTITSVTAKDGVTRGVKSTKILILGGGMAGIIAARTLKERGFENFIIIEARDELGGRVMDRMFGKKGQYHIEEGANFIQGTETPGGQTNPVLKLARKHNVSRRLSDFDSISMLSAALARRPVHAHNMKQRLTTSQDK
jgi:polyamine oxidase